MTHTLGWNVVVEGVENVEQIQFLKEKNVKLAQDYYYSFPISKYDVENEYYK